MQLNSNARSVLVSAPARLHLGFLDLGGHQGRCFGSIGLGINSHQTTVRLSAEADTTLSHAEDVVFTADHSERITAIVDQFYQVHPALSHAQPGIHIESLIPAHAGLGSGTQLALTVGKALSEFHGLMLNASEIAQMLGRGQRSGIGINTFEQGGFMVDGGLTENQCVPPLIAHQPFPAEWRMLLIMDPSVQGSHGQDEKQAFRDLPRFPLEKAQQICHLTLMQLLPALAEQQLKPFGDAVRQIQQLIGDHFAPAQGGRFTSQRVAALLNQAHDLGYGGIAQSSWGPTGCVFVESEAAGESLINQLTPAADANDQQPLQLIMTSAAQRGATVQSRH